MRCVAVLRRRLSTAPHQTPRPQRKCPARGRQLALPGASLEAPGGPAELCPREGHAEQRCVGAPPLRGSGVGRFLPAGRRVVPARGVGGAATWAARVRAKATKTRVRGGSRGSVACVSRDSAMPLARWPSSSQRQNAGSTRSADRLASFGLSGQWLNNCWTTLGHLRSSTGSPGVTCRGVWRAVVR